MKFVFRWFGHNDDSVSLNDVVQIPGISGVVSALQDIPAGEIWSLDRIKALQKEVNDTGLELEVIESVNVHEDIKLGLPNRDQYIDNYATTVKNLSKVGVKVICYNFMPVFDWLRSDLNFKLQDGSIALSYDEKMITATDPVSLVETYAEDSKGFGLPGWEPERLAELKRTLELYQDIDQAKLFENLKYFLEAIIPVCEKYDVKLAIHPDDPPWSIYDLPRLITSKESLQNVLDIIDSPYNGLTLCSGSLGVNKNNDIPALIRYFGKQGKIHFGHVRNIKIISERTFHETSHLSSDGSFDMYEIMKAYYDVGFEGYIRPDHGRMIWNEEARPGYGLYDRALGVMYLNGLWEAITKGNTSSTD